MHDDHIIILNNENIDISGAQVEHPSKIPQELLDQIDSNQRNPKVANRMITNSNFILADKKNTVDVYNYGSEVKRTKNSFEAGDNMTSDNFDTLFKELKDDLRERESRTRDEISKREERFERTVEKYQQENKEREERIYHLIQEIKNDNKEFKSDIKQEIQSIKEDYKQTQDLVYNLTKHNESIATTNKWSNIATIIGISAVVIASIIALLIS